MGKYLAALMAGLSLFAAPGDGLALMTLFNDTGGWQLGILENPDTDQTTWRACRNSKDRQTSETGAGSLAMLCVIVDPEAGNASLGIWDSERLGQPGGEIACEIEPGNDKIIRKTCKILPTVIGKINLTLTDDKNEVARVLARKSFRVVLGGRQTLEFDVDPDELKRVAPQVWNFFENLKK